MSRRKVLLAAIVGLAACCALAMRVRCEDAPGAAIDPKADIKTVLEAIKRSESEVTSLNGYFTWTQYGNEIFWQRAGGRVGNLPAPGTDQRGVFVALRKIGLAFSGDRWWSAERELLPRPACGTDFYHEVAYDGTSTYARETGSREKTGPSRGSIQSGRAADPSEMGIMAAGNVAYGLGLPCYEHWRLSATLARYPGAAVRGVEPMLDIPCYRIEARTEEGWTLAWWVAPSRGYRCARMVEIQDDAAGGLRSEQRVLQWRNFDGVWLPVHWVRRNWRVRNGKETTQVYCYIQAEEMVVNTPIADSTFRVGFQLGDWVQDHTVKEERGHVVGGDTADLEAAIARKDYPPEVRRDSTMEKRQ